jgi:hypothetical protein
MVKSTIAARPQHRLVALVFDARAILATHLQQIGPSKADTISAIVALLNGPDAVVAIATHNKLVEELRLAERIILVMLNEMSPDQKRRADATLTGAGVSPDGMTRYHERRAVLTAAGAV